MLAEVMAGLIVLALGAAGGAMWRRRAAIRRAPQQRFAEIRSARGERDIAKLRDEVRCRAEQLRVRIPLSAHGSRPRTVRWSDGSESRHFGDYTSYQDAMQTCRTDPVTSFPGSAPNPLNLWDPTRDGVVAQGERREDLTNLALY